MSGLREAQRRQEYRAEIMRGYQAALCNSDIPGWTLGDEVAKVADNLLATHPAEPAPGVALAVLKAHRLTLHEEDEPECSCGEWLPLTHGREFEEHDEHVAEMLESTAEPAPVANRERVAEVLSNATRDMDYKQWETPQGMLPFADALLAADVFRDEAKVKAKAWHAGHQAGWKHHQDGNHGNDYWDCDCTNPHRAGAS
jgi:hypothetical protein